jgi:hypothetical protein
MNTSIADRENPMPPTGYQSLIIVIPTRNRSDLAINAIRSVLDQPDCEVVLLVSDNSTSLEERTKLSEFCRQLQDKRLQYLTPPEPLPMSRHWDWAMEQALAQSNCSHVGFLTDRMMFKPGVLSSLVAILNAYPDKLLSYMHDEVDDFASPVLVRQLPWTGNLYKVEAAHLLRLSSQSVMYDSSVPRMLNCIVPRAILEAIRRRFGNIFDSISPDWNFAYRALDTVDSILFVDRAALVHYAQNRSNGQSVHYGITNRSNAEFTEDLGTTPQNFAAPFPEIITVWNAIINEYCHTKQVTGSPKFPDLDREKYIEALAAGIDCIKDPERQQYMRELLSARGWIAPEVPVAPPPAPEISSARRIAGRIVRSPRRIAGYVLRRLRPPRPVTEPVEPEETVNDEPERFAPNRLEFQNLDSALTYALSRPRRKALLSDHETITGGTRIPLREESQTAISPALDRKARAS